MTKDQFFIGQRVKQKDPDDGKMVYGNVKEIRDRSVIIDWDDLKGVEHWADEYIDIKPVNQSKFINS